MADNTVKTWNPTLLQTYDECPLRAYFKAVERIPEPKPDTDEEQANERGSRIHDEAELFVKGEGDLTYGLRHFDEDMERLRKLYDENKVILEELWALDTNWEPVEGNDWANHWGRLKIDVFVLMSTIWAIIIDYKTGKKFGNEIKHGDQVIQYAICAFLRYPELEQITVELWYLDQNDITSRTYTREQAMRFFPKLEHRVVFITTDTEFKPRPSKWNCRFCPYKTGLIGKKGPEGTGHCDLNPDQ